MTKTSFDNKERNKTLREEPSHMKSQEKTSESQNEDLEEFKKCALVA